MRINTIRLRVLAGLAGMLLPWIVVLLIGYFPQSISATYYTNACAAFMIILGGSSVVLICYKGYEKIDDILLTCSGLAGMLICLFPCLSPDGAEKIGTFMVNCKVSDTIHLVSAIIFFGLLSYNSIFLFTKGDGEPTKKKKIRNIIYRVCGIGMLASFLIMLLPDFRIKIWLVETFALTFFGVSFLTKANVIPFLASDGGWSVVWTWLRTKFSGRKENDVTADS